jgi:hypothetical protein
MNTPNDTYLEFIAAQDTIRLEALKLKFPEAVLDWDRNWVLTKVTIKAGVFSGQFSAEFMTTDFELLKRQLILLDKDFNKVAKFSPLEQQLILTIAGDGLGHFAIDCEATPEPNGGQKLTFSLLFDQTEIKNYIRQLDRITKQFPIDGDLIVDNK